MVKKGYKQTEIGVIPDDWEVKELKEMIKIGSGKSPSNFKFYDKGIPYFKVEQLNNANKYISYKDTKYFIKNNNSYISCCSIIFPKRGEAIFLNKIRILECNSFFDTNLMSLTINNDNLNHEYLFYYLSFQGLDKIADTTSVPQINNKHIHPFKIPIPPKPEQEKIAKVLSDTDELIENLKELIAKKEDIKKATMQQLLTGKKRLKGFSGEWVERKLGEIGEISGAGVDKKINKNEISVKLLNYLDVYKNDYLYPKNLNHWVTTTQEKIIKCNIKKGDILLTPSSELRKDIGISALAMEDMNRVVYSYHINRLRLKIDFDILFSLYMLKTHDFLTQCETVSEGSGKRYVISLKKFREMKVLFPQDITEQKAIAKILSDMDEEIEALKEKLEKTEAIKQGMMQELLSGRMRLI